MASISVANGKFQIFRNADSSGASPFTSIMAATDGAACLLKDSEGRLWCFRIFEAKLQYKKSTDTEGTTLTDDTWHDIVATLVKDGVPTAVLLPTGRITVLFWKTDDKWYQAYTNNQTDFTIVEVTT